MRGVIRCPAACPQVTELAALTMLPNKLLQWRVVHPMKLVRRGRYGCMD